MCAIPTAVKETLEAELVTQVEEEGSKSVFSVMAETVI